MACDFVSYSDKGGRENNEDSIFAGKIGDGYLFAVADGLGGHDCGEIASSMAIEALKDYLEFPPNELYISDAVNEANNRILKYQAQTSTKMRTTVSVAYIYDGNVTLAHVGDSRIYLLKDGKMIFQSLDHSVPQAAVLTGEIQQSDIRNHPDRNKLTRALGVTSDLKIDISKFSLNDADSFLICSDGFWEYIFENEIEQTRKASKNAKAWLSKMTELVVSRQPSNCDNTSAVSVFAKKCK